MFLHERFIDDELTDQIKLLIDNLISSCSSPSWYKSTVNGKDYVLMQKEKELSFIVSIYENILNLKLKLQNAWTIYGEEGTYHTIHRHSQESKYICTVLFLDTSGVSTPNGDFYAVVHNQPYQYSPKKGDLLIFSSDVCHGTYPQSKGLRQTLNLDFIPL